MKTTPEATPVITDEQKPKTKGPKASKAPKAPAKKLTKNEKIIKQLEQTIAELEVIVEQYRQNAEAAFEQARRTTEERERMQQYFIKRLEFCEKQAVAAANSISLATKGDY